MQFGPLSGLINGTEQVVFDYEVSGSAASSISTGSILNGDEDLEYIIILRRISNGSTYARLQINGDSGANYGHRGIVSAAASVSDDATTGAASMQAEASTNSNGNSGLQIYKLYAKSGSVRLISFLTADDISGTTVNYAGVYGGVWNNTADNLTSLTFISSSGSAYGIGSRLTILKLNNFSGGTPTGIITTPYIKGSWYRVGSTVLGATASSVTFSSLDGDRDVIYMLLGSFKAYGGVAQANIQINSDSGLNYTQQWLQGNNATVASTRRSGDPTIYIDANTTTSSGNYGNFACLLFAKSGFIRPILSQYITNASGTTVTATGLLGGVWNNAGSNITSISIGSAGNFDVGSQFSIYALRPNA